MKYLNKVIILIFLFISFNAQSQQLNEAEIKGIENDIYKIRRDLDPIEGLWLVSTQNTYYNLLGERKDFKICNDIALLLILKNKKDEYGYTVQYFNSKEDFKMQYLDDFIDSERGGSMIKKNSKFAEFTINMPGLVSKYNQSVNFSVKDNGIINFKYYMDATKKITKEGQIEFDVTLIKKYPHFNLKKSERVIKSTGTGFAISQNGYIVTNEHVINGATKIRVYGVNGDFSNYFEANWSTSDKESDIAIIKIADSDFKFKKPIPYMLDYLDKPVGTSIYTLGYPMISLMGSEIKITDGIKSSSTGFRGDDYTFQTSIPIQPGNSGSPLFTKQGELVGVINSKLTSGDNVSYAIKMKHLKDILMTEVGNKIILPKVNLLKGKDLVHQIQLCKEFVFIIEVEE